MGRIHKGYLIAALVLSIVIFLGSIYLFPNWRTSTAGLFVLAGLVIVGVVTLLANWRTMTDNKENVPERKIEMVDGAYIEGQLTLEKGDYVARDKNIYIQIPQENAYDIDKLTLTNEAIRVLRVVKSQGVPGIDRLNFEYYLKMVFGMEDLEVLLFIESLVSEKYIEEIPNDKLRLSSKGQKALEE